MPIPFHHALATSLIFFPFLTSAIEITEGSFEDRAQFIVKTESATYYYDRAGGGFSKLIDLEGRDWIAFSKDPLKKFPESAAAGYRGMPNAVFGSENPDAGAGHPGFDQCESTLIGDDTIRTISKSGKWAWSWRFTESTTTMTMERADPDHAWWFLYEGPIAGSFDPKRKFWGTDKDGYRTDIPDIRNQFFSPVQWIYFGDTEADHVLLIAQHEADHLDDTVWYLGSSDGGAANAPDGMMVFGFGRGNGTKPLFTGSGQKFTFSFLKTGGIDPESFGMEIHETAADTARRIVEGRPIGAAPDRRIRLFQGATQRFGHLGEPQRWINVVGHVGNPGMLDSINFSLNGGKARNLSVGTDLHRLALPGDFNIELAWDELRPGRNQLTIVASYSDGATIRSDVTLEIERDNEWPLPYRVDFSQVTDLQSVVQIVDGEWRLTDEGVRTAQPWYDRVLAMGDNSWTDYEATVLLTLHGFTPPQPGAPTYNVTHMGVALRWRGHTADGRQPSRRWFPLGAQGEYLLKNDLSQNRYRILHNGGPGWKPAHGENVHPVKLGKPFFIKAQVHTLSDGRSVYRFKQWNEGKREPDEWAVESSEPAETDLPSGALCLVPHNSDVTIHEVKIVPLNTP